MSTGHGKPGSEERQRVVQALVRRRLLSSEEIEVCLQRQRELAAEGIERSLEAILLEGELVDEETMVDVLRSVRAAASRPEGIVLGGRYRLGELIGQGACARVYRARDERLGRDVAIKLIEDLCRRQEKGTQRFEQEAKALARLKHPNIVAVHDISWSIDGDAYLVMDLVEGRPLDDLLEEGQTDRATLLGILGQVALGVEHAHQAGIVHRDLKPANILVDPAGVPQIVDFGLARLAQEDLGLTASGAVLGTPLYMAPEQLAGRNDRVGPASDIYALGVILYQILTGRLPYEARTRRELQAAMRRPPTPPDELDPTVAASLSAICLQAMERSPGRRHASAGSLAADLAGSRPAGDLVVRLSRRHVIAAAAVGLFATGALVALAWPGQRVDGATDESAPGPEAAPAASGPLEPTGWILWRIGSKASLWAVDDGGRHAEVAVHSNPGWEARSIDAGSDGRLRLLWMDDASHRGSFWSLDERGRRQEEVQFAWQWQKWRVRDFERLEDGTERLLWVNTDSNQLSLYRLDAGHALTTYTHYDPRAPHWRGVSYEELPDGRGRIVWAIEPGRAKIWLLDSRSEFEREVDLRHPLGWQPVDLVVESDGRARFLWAGPDGHADLWFLDAGLRRVDGRVYGPNEGAEAVGYDLGRRR